ncbi:Uncharacterized protein FKW44_004742, partial [Caligus rogercresseyi]
EYEHGTNGWTIGHLDGNSFHIVTRNSNPVCPEGINGAYDRDITHDSTFNIACHSEKVKIDCCPKVKISSSSVVAKAQSAHLGEYSLMGVTMAILYTTKRVKMSRATFSTERQ